MNNLKFTKMVASGNDFVVIPLSRYPVIPLKNLAKKICDRKYGVGADGLLILEKSKIADVKMRIFNADGSEAEMCGNGARCVAFYVNSKLQTPNSKLNIATKAGIIESQVTENNVNPVRNTKALREKNKISCGVKIKLTDPKNIKLDIPVKVNAHNLKVNFIDTGVPHVVIFVEGLDKIDVTNLGRLIRYHKKFAPRGTNVNFIEILGEDSIKIRTYERGVEDETLACGTGSVASSIVFALKTGISNKIKAHTKGREISTVYFTRKKDQFSDVWLEGKTRIVYKGEYYV